VCPASRERPALELATTLYLDDLATKVTSALAEVGVRAVLLKGASFRDLLFDLGELRRYTDVDLLVSPAQTADAAAVLERLGFVDTFAGAAPSETSPIATEFRGSHAIVDLHRSLPGVTVPEAAAWEALSVRTRTMALGRGVVEILDDAGRCLHVALNAASDGKARSREDLRRAVQRQPEATWRQVAELAEGLGALPSLVAAFALVPEGEALRRSLKLDVRVPLGVALRAQAPPPLALGLHRLLTTSGLRSKAAFLARRLVPTPAGLRYWTPLARRGRVGMVLAYAWRPFHLVRHAPSAVLALVRTWKRN
jgi:hypothetical protein